MKRYRPCVAIILMKESKIFWALRNDVPDAWQLPQGGIETNENVLEAAKRELFEETGISSVKYIKKSAPFTYDFPKDVRSDITKKYGSLKYDGQEMTFVVFEFLGSDAEINLNNTVVEFSDWKWQTPAEILENIVDFKRDAYKKAFASLQGSALHSYVNRVCQ